MDEKVKLALAAEQAIETAIQEIIQEIDKGVIKSFEQRKFKQLSKNVVIVNLKDLDEGLNLDPNNYILTSQAQYVRDDLKRSKNITDMMSRIREMVKTGYAMGKSRRLRLNPHTASVVKMYAREKLGMSFDEDTIEKTE